MPNFSYQIIKIADLFSALTTKDAKELPLDFCEKRFVEVTVNYESPERSSMPRPINCGLDHNLGYPLRIGNFTLERMLHGSIWHKEGFGKEWELNLKVKDSEHGQFENLIISGGDFTNSFGKRSIVDSIARFFNELQQFENLQDWHAYHNAQKTNSEKKQEEAEAKMLRVGELINLCAKYKAINPVSPITKNLHKIIETHLKDIIR